MGGRTLTGSIKTYFHFQLKEILERQKERPGTIKYPSIFRLIWSHVHAAALSCHSVSFFSVSWAVVIIMKRSRLPASQPVRPRDGHKLIIRQRRQTEQPFRWDRCCCLRQVLMHRQLLVCFTHPDTTSSSTFSSTSQRQGQGQ